MTRSNGPVLFATVCALVASACTEPSVEETAEPGIGSVVVTQWNDSTELFLEYPHVVAGEATGNWAIHLSSMATFEPIRTGTLRVDFVSGGTVAESFTIEGVARDGIFLLDPVVAEPGRYAVELHLDSPQARSTHRLSDVQVFASVAEAPVAEEEAEGAGIAFLKEQQWQIPWRVTPADTGTIRQTTSVPGEVVAPDGALVRVGAPVAGIALEEPNRAAPSVGQRVSEGQVLAVLAPTAQEGGFARTVATLQRLEREVARTERLLEVGAIPARRLEEARHELEVARAEAEAMGASDGADPFRLELVSPMSGIVAARDFVPGGRVEAGSPLFTIVEPGAAWIRLSVPAEVAGSIPDDARVTYRVEGTQEVRGAGSLVSVGRFMDPRTRTVPVTFDISGDDARPIFGQLVDGFVPTSREESGVILPTAAIIDDNGADVAYVQLGGETFERRILTLGPTDGVRTLVRSGVSPGEIVVIRGAYQVRLASMSGSEIAGGHTH